MCIICDNEEKWMEYARNGTIHSVEVGIIDHILWKFLHMNILSTDAFQEISHVHYKAAEMHNRVRAERLMSKDPMVSKSKESM
jgi:hypothetical protein